MMSFFSKPKNHKVIMALDVSSSSVGGIVIKIDGATGQAEIVASARKSANYLFDVDLKAAMRCSLESLKNVLSKLAQDYPGKPDNVLCVFSSPWFISQAKILNLKKGKPFEVKEELFGKIIYEEEESFKNNLPKWSADGQNSYSAEFIEHEDIKTELNGYFTENPFGKTAKTLKIHIYLSMGLKDFIGKIKKEVSGKFGALKITFKTFPMVAFRALNSIMKTEEDFILTNVGGEMTDLLLVKGGALEDVVSFPKGINFLYRKIASDSNTFLKEAPSRLKTYLRGHMAAGSAEKLRLAIKENEKEWGALFEKAIASMSESHLLPENVFLIGDYAAQKIFSRNAENAELSKYAVLGKPFSVKKIHPGWVAHYLRLKNPDTLGKWRNEIDEAGPDTALMMEAFLASRIF